MSSLVALEWARKSTGSGGRPDSVFCWMTVNKLAYPLTLNFFKFEWFKKIKDNSVKLNNILKVLISCCSMPVNQL